MWKYFYIQWLMIKSVSKSFVLSYTDMLADWRNLSPKRLFLLKKKKYPQTWQSDAVDTVEMERELFTLQFQFSSLDLDRFLPCERINAFLLRSSTKIFSSEFPFLLKGGRYTDIRFRLSQNLPERCVTYI